MIPSSKQARTALLAAAALLAACGPRPAVAVDVAETAAAVIERTNAFRREQGLEAVSSNEKLKDAAKRFARYMAKTGKYGHTADGRRPPQRAAAQGYDYCIVSENIAYQYRSTGYESPAALAEQFVEGWKHSPEHRKNMVDPAVTQTGIGVAQGEQGRYFAVQMFGRPKSASIRFSVRNRSGEKVAYRVGERSYPLPPRATRTHRICRAAELSIGKDFSAKAADGARYTVTGEGVVSDRP